MMCKKHILLFFVFLILFFYLFSSEYSKISVFHEITSDTQNIKLPDRTTYDGFILKVPRIYLQKSDKTCSAAALRYFLATKKIKVDEKTLGEKLKIDNDGASFLDIKNTALTYNIKFKGLKTDFDSLKSFSSSILHFYIKNTDTYHFVVFLKISQYDDNVFLFDPLFGYVFISKKDFLKAWTGYALVEE